MSGKDVQNPLFGVGGVGKGCLRTPTFVPATLQRQRVLRHGDRPQKTSLTQSQPIGPFTAEKMTLAGELMRRLGIPLVSCRFVRRVHNH
jgi:hypothetical protein